MLIEQHQSVEVDSVDEPSTTASVPAATAGRDQQWPRDAD